MFIAPNRAAYVWEEGCFIVPFVTCLIILLMLMRALEHGVVQAGMILTVCLVA